MCHLHHALIPARGVTPTRDPAPVTPHRPARPWPRGPRIDAFWICPLWTRHVNATRQCAGFRVSITSSGLVHVVARVGVPFLPTADGIHRVRTRVAWVDRGGCTRSSAGGHSGSLCPLAPVHGTTVNADAQGFMWTWVFLLTGAHPGARPLGPAATPLSEELPDGSPPQPRRFPCPPAGCGGLLPPPWLPGCFTAASWWGQRSISVWF